VQGLDPDVEVIDVGKQPGRHPVPQEEINRIIVERAAAGLRVVRLKGGDPFVFGRGGEEMLACLAAGIPVDVTPGITSAIAVPQSAGIPVTHRGTAAAFHVVNGQGRLGPGTLGAMADATVTTVVLMGVAALGRLVESAIAHGIPKDRPVAFVESGHTPQQRTTRTTLGRAVDDALAVGLRNPAVIVIGEVASERLLLPSPSTIGAALA
jgi:uroporphyrin-III C-methyltransferase/precorrin-2 dehydrogenase/sirohydrochlorin ferrochelatase